MRQATDGRRWTTWQPNSTAFLIKLLIAANPWTVSKAKKVAQTKHRPGRFQYSVQCVGGPAARSGTGPETKARMSSFLKTPVNNTRQAKAPSTVASFRCSTWSFDSANTSPSRRWAVLSAEVLVLHTCPQRTWPFGPDLFLPC